MSEQVWVAIVLGLFVLCIVGASWWQKRVMARESAQRQADRMQYSQRRCPSCEQLYGADVQVFFPYGRNAKVLLDLQRRMPSLDGAPFVPFVFVICPHCRYHNWFDRQGRHHPELSFSQSAMSRLMEEGNEEEHRRPKL
jgi:hypothetical protein